METRTAEVQELLDLSKQAYTSHEFADAFNYAQEAFEIDKYDAEVYMYRAFSHLMYHTLSDDSIYEQSIIDDIDIVLNIGYENGETERYYELCLFCCRELLSYYLFLLDWTMEEFHNKRNELPEMTDSEYNQAINEYLSGMCIPVEEAVEMLWEFAIFSKIGNFEKCPGELLEVSINFIEAFRNTTGRYSFYETEDRFRDIVSSKEAGEYERTVPEQYDLKSYLVGRKAFWIKHKTLLRGAAEEKISLMEEELNRIEFQKKNAGFFAFGKKKELQEEIDAKVQEMVFLKGGMNAEIEAVNKLLEELESKISSL